MAQPPKTPAPPRRKAATRKTTRATTRKPAAPKTPKTDGDETVSAAAAPKPATQRQPAVRKTSRAKTAAGTVAAKASAAKSSATKAASSAAKTVADSAPAQFVSDTREKMGDRNFFAALIGGVAAIGAAVAGVVIALRDGNPDGPAKAKDKGGPKKG